MMFGNKKWKKYIILLCLILGIVWVFNSLFWYVLLHYYKLALSLKTDILQSWALITVYQLQNSVAYRRLD